jgi:putative DNA primase/helicase
MVRQPENQVKSNGRELGQWLDDQLKSAIAHNPHTLCGMIGLRVYEKNDGGYWITDRREDGKPRMGCIDAQHLTILSIGKFKTRIRIYEYLCECLGLSMDQWREARAQLAQAYGIQASHFNGQAASHVPAQARGEGGSAMERTPQTQSAAREPFSSAGKKKKGALYVPPPLKKAEDIKNRKQRFTKFLARRPGVTEKSFLAAGGHFRVWQPNVEWKFYVGVWVLPGYRVSPDGECYYPSTWVMYAADGKKNFEWKDKRTGEQRECKVRTFPRNKGDRPGGDGIIIVGKERFNDATPRWLCEGPTDALALDGIRTGDGIATAVSNGAGTLGKEAAALFAGDEPVYILFDNDDAGDRGRLHAAKTLMEAGVKNVKHVRLPKLENGKDVRDFVNGGGTYEELLAIAEKAPWVTMEVVEKALEEQTKIEWSARHKSNDSFHLAMMFLQSYQTDQGPLLRFWNGEMLLWQEGCYVGFPKDDFRAALSKWIWGFFEAIGAEEARKAAASTDNDKQAFCMNVTMQLVHNVENAVKSLCIVGSDVEQPAWIDKDGKQVKGAFPASELLNCAGYLIHVPSLAAGDDDCAISTTPAFFSPTALDCEFQPDALAPSTWLRFLDQLFPNDAESIELLHQWFGYCLLPRMEQQKVLMLVGPPRSGKGTIAHVLERLIGKDNIAAPTLASLGDTFGLQPLLGKSLAVISDARLSGRNDIAQIVENILRITGEDAVTINRKFLPPLSTHLGIRMMILTNEVPDLRDASGAAASRFIVLRLRHSFLCREDHGLQKRLCGELPGILNLGLDGWNSLRDKGRFTEPKSSRSTVEELQNLTSPVAAFINEFYDECAYDERTGSGKLLIGEVFKKWEGWCEERGRKPGDDSHFSRNVLAAFPKVESKQKRMGKTRPRWFLGLEERQLEVGSAAEEDDDP